MLIFVCNETDLHCDSLGFTVITNLVSGLAGNMDNINIGEEDIASEIKEIESSSKLTLLGVSVWLAVVTIATIIVFVVVYKRLGRNVDNGSDAEMGSKKANCSIVNVSELIFPELQRDQAPPLPEKSKSDETGISVECPTDNSTTDLPTLHSVRH